MNMGTRQRQRTLKENATITLIGEQPFSLLEMLWGLWYIFIIVLSESG